jgi:GxxExxY protein
MEEDKKLPNSELTGTILNSCFEVMNEVGPGFFEKVYKNALLLAMKHKGLKVEVERPYEVMFRGNVIGRYFADLVVEKTVIVELKCCETLLREHQAQLFNYLKVSRIPVGLLVNFRHKKLEWKRLQSNEGFSNSLEEILEKSMTS